MHGDELSRAMAPTPVQLAVLSGCFTGAAASQVSDELFEGGLTAVVAMQAPINDASAGLFARAFYGTLGEGSPVEEAVQQGRSAIRGMGSDWAVPVLFLSTTEPVCFEREFTDDGSPGNSVARHNLTYDERPFIGRAVERTEIRDRIRLKRQRLVTITGMGGMGKTRLGKQITSELLDDFPDGGWMVECDSLATREDLVGKIASVLGVGAPNTQLEEALIRHISNRRLLIFLDCFEQLVEHAQVIERLISQSMDCYFIVSSRIVLGLPREFEYRLNPMALNKKGTQSSESMSLFAEAAGHAVNAFEIDSKNRALIRELCAELDGVPLALVLAAGRLRHLGLADLLEQIRSNPLETLKRRGGVNDRHGDIRRVVAGSFLLLEEGERTLLDHLSLFVGGFSLNDAVEVCGRSKTEIIDRLSTLRDNSLIQVQALQNHTRYKLLDTVREYIDQLPRDDSALERRNQCADRHAHRFCRVADEIGALMNQGRWGDGTALLWAELGNLRAAIDYCAHFAHHELVRRFADGLLRPFFEASQTADFDRLASASHAAADALCDIGLTSRLYGLEGAQAAIQKDYPTCIAIWMKRLALCESTNDEAGCADTLSDLSSTSLTLGKIDEALSYIEQAQVHAERLHSPGQIASCLVNKARIALETGDLESAKMFARKAEETVDTTIEKDLYPYVFQVLAILYDRFGDVEHAKELLMTLLGLSMEGKRLRQVIWCLIQLGGNQEREENLESAALYFLAASKLNREIQSRYTEGLKTSWVQFSRRNPEIVSRLASETRRESWEEILKRLQPG